MSDWTPERVDALKEKFAAGKSFSVIAREIGGISRCAVAGKVRRLELPMRASPGSRKSYHRAIAKMQHTIVPVAEAPDTGVLVDGAPVTIMTIRDGLCRWPIGDPASKDFCFCGRPAVGTYCEGHDRKAHEPRIEK
jgi:GcrA cell cycle regulator